MRDLRATGLIRRHGVDKESFRVYSLEMDGTRAKDVAERVCKKGAQLVYKAFNSLVQNFQNWKHRETKHETAKSTSLTGLLHH